MWLPRPLYEFLPFLHMLLGTLLLLISFFVAQLSLWLALLGVLLLAAGLVLWLKRRDYRTAKAEYKQSSLDD